MGPLTRGSLILALGALIAGATSLAAAQPEPTGDEPAPAPDEDIPGAPDPEPQAPDPDAEEPLDVDEPEPPADEPLEATEPQPAPQPEGPPAISVMGPILPRSYLEWPKERVLRPVTLPRGAWALGLDLRSELDLGTVRLGAGLGAGPVRDGLWFAFGLTDQAEFDLSYAFALRDFEIRGPVRLGSAFNLVRDGVLDVSARAGLGWNFDTDGFSPVVAGLDSRYLLNARMAILLLPRQLVWSLDDNEAGDKPISLDLPVGFGLQLAPPFYAELDIQLLRWSIRDAGGSKFIGADFAPVQARLFWSPGNQVDVGAGIGADLRPEGDLSITDTGSILVQVRYYGLD